MSGRLSESWNKRSDGSFFYVHEKNKKKKKKRTSLRRKRSKKAEKENKSRCACVCVCFALASWRTTHGTLFRGKSGNHSRIADLMGSECTAEEELGDGAWEGRFGVSEPQDPNNKFRSRQRRRGRSKGRGLSGSPPSFPPSPPPFSRVIRTITSSRPSHAPDDVIVLELLQQRNLTNSRRRHPLLLLLQPDALQRHDVVRGSVARFVHHAVRALSDFFQLFKVVHGRGNPSGRSRRRRRTSRRASRRASLRRRSRHRHAPLSSSPRAPLLSHHSPTQG